MSQPDFAAGKLLNAVTTTGDSSVVTLPGVMSKFGMVVSISGGTLSAVSTTLQGSVDGANWTTLATSSATGGDTQFAVDKPVGYIKANLGTRTVATGTPAITVHFSGCR